MRRPPTVFMLHSFGSAGRSWNGVCARLGVAAVAPDLPGFGATPPLADPSMAAYADWTLARLQEIEGEVVLVGASMGGKIAMAAAARRPPRLRALLLCAPSPPAGEPMSEVERARQLHARGDPEAAAESVRKSTCAPPASAPFQAAVDDWLRTSGSAWRWWWAEGSREVIDTATVTAPALVLAGDRDDHLGGEVQVRETMPRLTTAALRTVPGSRHLLALDQPQAVADAIKELGRAERAVDVHGDDQS